MKYKLISKIALLALPLNWLSCDTIESPSDLGTDKVKISFSIDSYENAAITKTTVSDLNRGIIHWTEGDIVGVFPYKGYQEPFEIPISQINQANAVFDGGHWALREGLSYNAYYPFDIANFASDNMKTKIALSYSGQSQYDTEINTGKYDFSYSEWQTSPASGQMTFKFHHIGCLTVLNVVFPATATYMKIEVVVKDPIGDNSFDSFPIEGTYDLTYNKDKTPAEGESYVKIPYNGTVYKDRIGLDLYNSEGTDGFGGILGETATFYMMLPQVDLISTAAGKKIRFILHDKEGNTYQSSADLVNFQQGKKYTFTIMPVADYEGNIDVTPEIGDWNDSSASSTPPPVFE